jgi:hypothetical protein
MKTKLFKTYSRAVKTATTESVFIEATDVQMFAHRSELFDNEVDVVERAFSWTTNQVRVLRVFQMRNGDYGFRWYEGAMNDKIADRVFSDRASAVEYLNSSAHGYTADVEHRGWKEVLRG